VDKVVEAGAVAVVAVQVVQALRLQVLPRLVVRLPQQAVAVAVAAAADAEVAAQRNRRLALQMGQ
jgi:hypothetical protein